MDNWAMYLYIGLQILIGVLFIYFLYKGYYRWELKEPVVDAAEGSILRATQELSMAIYEFRMEIDGSLAKIIAKFNIYSDKND